MEKILDRNNLLFFKQRLLQDEKSTVTVKKYMHDITQFFTFAENKTFDKALVLKYKQNLEKHYTPTSANSMLAALNSFFKFCGWQDLCVKQFKIQKQIYRSANKELTRAEYERLIKTAVRTGNNRLNLIIQTICATGIRVSELSFITVEAVKRGEAVVSCKGKKRTVFIVSNLRKKLLNYINSQKISQGTVFITTSGKPIDRSNIWRQMKSLCLEANVSPEKVFPHNLRHLFAITFYRIEKDIAKLADILGHTSINTTRIYIITSGDEHRRKLENMRLVI